MSLRIPLLLGLLLASACTQETPPPQTRVPVSATTSVAAPAAAAATSQWRAVLMAGDNTSPAFDNGVASLRDKLAGHGVRDIKIFSSSSSRIDRARWATGANMSAALKSGGGEGCIAFVTSHGAERGIYLRPDGGLYTPASLDQALTEGCGTAPTVVIMSACHSGTFIDSRMRKPNRVILTAAATDRSSFGCGTGNQYTYYDRCLLTHFDSVATWRELAEATRACVEVQEREFGIRTPSMPQTYFGAEVANLKLPGR